MVGLSSTAMAAGKGGVAGAVSFMLDGTHVTEASASVAVGKETAYATADTVNMAGQVQSMAVGTGGIITFTGDSVLYTGITQDGDLAAQVNEIASVNTDINIVSGTFSQEN